MASPAALSYQIRWKQTKTPGELRDRLFSYLRRLQRGRSVRPFESNWSREGDQILYEWSGPGRGMGALLYSPCSQRVFFLEVTSEASASLTKPYTQFVESFADPACEREEWAAFGLRLRLPAGLQVEKRAFLSGRTSLGLKSGRTRLEADRWAFGLQLVQRHGLEPWAREALDLADAAAREEAEGLRLTAPRRGFRAPCEAIVRLEEERNQIVCVKVIGSGEEWRPRWDWLI